MSLIARRIIFYCLLTVFLIAAPLAIGYTTGYRYSPAQRRLVKTGALSIASEPQGAEIILNNQRLNIKTQSLIRHLTPGSYEITLEKDGYYQWTKTLFVESEKTTFAHNAPLFKKSAPELSPDNLASDASEFKSSTIQFSQHEVWQYDKEQKTTTLITRLIEEIQNVIPLSGDKAILLIFKNRVQAMETDLRDRQNTWNLAEFDAIKNATLTDDGKTLQILGTYQGKEGMWTLKLQ